MACVAAGFGFSARTWDAEFVSCFQQSFDFRYHFHQRGQSFLARVILRRRNMSYTCDSYCISDRIFPAFAFAQFCRLRSICFPAMHRAASTKLVLFRGADAPLVIHLKMSRVSSRRLSAWCRSLTSRHDCNFFKPMLTLDLVVRKICAETSGIRQSCRHSTVV